MTRSKGPAEELSLPPTRMRKDVSTANEGEENAQDRLFFDPLLSTTTGSTGSQSDSAHDPTQDCNSTPPKVHTPSPRIPEPTIPPTPYVNQAAVEQHIRTQSPSVPPRNIATVAPPPRESLQASFAQETLITLTTSQITPPQAQNQLTTSPQRPRKSKSKDGRGIKQSKNVNTTDTAQVCWRCGEPGHKKRDCHKPPFCGKCRKEGHVPALCPLSTGPTLPSPLQQQVDKFSNPTNRCIHCGGAHVPGSCPVRYQPKATSSTSKYGSPKQSTEDNNVASVQVRSQVTPQVSPLAQVNTLAQPTHTNSFPPPPYFPIPFPPPCPTFKCFYSSFSSSLGSVCSYILDDKRSQSRKRQHHEHHRRVAEDNDAVCGRVAENHTEGSGSPSGRKPKCKVRQTV